MAILANLGIDAWGVVLYLVNFGILFFFLNKYLYRPLLSFLDERRQTIKDSLEAAERARVEFAEKTTAHEAEMRDKMSMLESEIIQVKNAASSEAAKLVKEAEERRDRMVQEARQLIESAKRGMVQEVEVEILQRVERAIIAVLGKKVDATEVKKSVSEAWHDATK